MQILARREVLVSWKESTNKIKLIKDECVELTPEEIAEYFVITAAKIINTKNLINGEKYTICFKDGSPLTYDFSFLKKENIEEVKQ